ncbi:MAG: hypothetical protein QXG48_02770 [Thermofilaceae archaeon]
MSTKPNIDAIRSMLEREPGKVLAALGIPPYSGMYTEEEKRKVMEAMGIASCPPCLLVSFVCDVLLPPPFRPPLMLFMCFASGSCP